jgi:hypothetical protein
MQPRLWDLENARLAELAQLPQVENWDVFAGYVTTQRTEVLERLAVEGDPELKCWWQAQAFALQELLNLPAEARQTLAQAKAEREGEDEEGEEKPDERRPRKRFGFRGV